MRRSCVFTSDGYLPEHCLHEYKLLHAFVHTRLRQVRPGHAHDYARLAIETQSYAGFLRTKRPFDPSQVSNPVPRGSGVPGFETGQSNLLCFEST